jgi:transcriptional regulator with XRE-family HTH domain
MRRNMLRMSQIDLAADIGVTFQQVQKYEKGTNRIGASRLQRIAEVLGVPVAWFFERKEGSDKKDGADEITRFLREKTAPRLVRSFVRLSPTLKRSVARLVETIAEA